MKAIDEKDIISTTDINYKDELLNKQILTVKSANSYFLVYKREIEYTTIGGVKKSRIKVNRYGEVDKECKTVAVYKEGKPGEIKPEIWIGIQEKEELKTLRIDAYYGTILDSKYLVLNNFNKKSQKEIQKIIQQAIKRAIQNEKRKIPNKEKKVENQHEYLEVIPEEEKIPKVNKYKE